ncbi:hypothetical protein [Tumebacillus flagellatus]|uniref:Uncharacterized protein n=1 Tax=Tumebacillus flagellatus TaxID=1157490 RepID=A0A074MDJ7_9BACL|nr:hypothetical protein [Tumebacillus flagellatus]KEO83922.1 hypothetical protein EL26_06965 [Tumebacillus flagellatus]
MDYQQILAALQHSPLPERMGNFERTRSPQEPLPVDEGEYLVVEYRHLHQDALFQVFVRGEEAQFIALIDGEVRPLTTVSVEEAGHLLRRDLLMTLEDLEDEL